MGGGDPFQLRSWSEGWLKLKSSLEKPSDKCQKTHIIQNLFHGAEIIFCFYFLSTKGGGAEGRRLVENSTIFFNPSLITCILLFLPNFLINYLHTHILAYFICAYSDICILAYSPTDILAYRDIETDTSEMSIYMWSRT